MDFFFFPVEDDDLNANVLLSTEGVGADPKLKGVFPVENENEFPVEKAEEAPVSNENELLLGAVEGIEKLALLEKGVVFVLDGVDENENGFEEGAGSLCAGVVKVKFKEGEGVGGVGLVNKKGVEETLGVSLVNVKIGLGAGEGGGTEGVEEVCGAEVFPNEKEKGEEVGAGCVVGAEGVDENEKRFEGCEEVVGNKVEREGSDESAGVGAEIMGAGDCCDKGADVFDVDENENGFVLGVAKRPVGGGAGVSEAGAGMLNNEKAGAFEGAFSITEGVEEKRVKGEVEGASFFSSV